MTDKTEKKKVTTGREIKSYSATFYTKTMNDRNVAGYMVTVTLEDGTVAGKFMSSREFEEFEKEHRGLKRVM